MRTPATWPLHTGRRAPPTETRPATTPETIVASPPPEAKPDAPPPLGPTQSHRAGEPLLRPPAAPAQSSPSPPSPSSANSPSSSSPNPPSLETILAASSDEPTDSQGWRAPKVLIAGLASLGVLVPCLAGAAFMMLSPGAAPLALLPLGRTDTTASLPAPPAAPAISAAREKSVASEEPQASTPEPHHAAALPEPDAYPPPPAPVVAADPAPARANSPASELGADKGVAGLVPEKDAAAAEVGSLEPHQAAASPEPVAPPLPPAQAVAASPTQLPPPAPASEAGPDKNIAAVEPEKDAPPAEVGSLEPHHAAASPEPVASAPPLSAPSGMAMASATPGDACRRDEERLAELQAKPSIKDVLNFADEFSCSKLQPQILALLDSLGRTVQSEGAPGANGALPSKKLAGETRPAALGAVGYGSGSGDAG
jgi:hypothetical protein